MSGAKLEGGKSVLHIGAQTRPLRGELSLPGDKSISHRALIFSALAEGESVLTGLSTGADVGSTRRVLSALGVAISGEAPGPVRVKGAGVGGLRPPADGAPIDCGNSGTTVRLLAGVVAQAPGRFVFTGDASLSARPMERIAAPLRAMGAKVSTGEGGGLPLVVEGPVTRPIVFQSPVASAQVKSCVLLAGLALRGETAFAAPARSRDHTERMLRARGVPVDEVGGRCALRGPVPALVARDLKVAGDPSSAAFLVVAAALVPGSELRLTGLCANPGRTRYLEVLEAMGVPLVRERVRDGDDAPSMDLRVGAAGEAASLRAQTIEADVLPAIIDEVPILAVAAAFARGTSCFRGAGELRHKESDRLAGILDLLDSAGIVARTQGDDLLLEGASPRALTRPVDSRGDHRLAMAGSILALAAGGGTIEGAGSIAISYPGFVTDLEQLGVQIT